MYKYDRIRSAVRNIPRELSEATFVEVEHFLLLLRGFTIMQVMRVLNFIKEWTLPCAMVLGAGVYLLFSEVRFLRPVGNAVGPVIMELMPVLIFAILYVTFCKIHLHDLRLRPWHIWLQVIRTGLILALVAVITLTEHETKLILEGLFVCIICPTAAAAAVITDKLGGSIASMTVYTLIDNAVTSLLIPLLFPLVEKETGISFATSFYIILEKVLLVLILPFVCAMATRRWLPKLAARIQEAKNLGFYMWAFNLSIVMGLTLHNILESGISGMTMTLLLAAPLAVTFLLFGIGKSVGRRYGESICGGQALGQKNTIVAIWLTVTYLNPTAAIAPCAYVVWQNIVNAWQLWCKEKYGKLKW